MAAVGSHMPPNPNSSSEKQMPLMSIASRTKSVATATTAVDTTNAMAAPMSPPASDTSDYAMPNPTRSQPLSVVLSSPPHPSTLTIQNQEAHQLNASLLSPETLTSTGVQDTFSIERAAIETTTTPCSSTVLDSPDTPTPKKQETSSSHSPVVEVASSVIDTIRPSSSHIPLSSLPKQKTTSTINNRYSHDEVTSVLGSDPALVESGGQSSSGSSHQNAPSPATPTNAIIRVRQDKVSAATIRKDAISAPGMPLANQSVERLVNTSFPPRSRSHSHLHRLYHSQQLSSKPVVQYARSSISHTTPHHHVPNVTVRMETSRNSRKNSTIAPPIIHNYHPPSSAETTTFTKSEKASRSLSPFNSTAAIRDENISIHSHVSTSPAARMTDTLNAEPKLTTVTEQQEPVTTSAIACENTVRNSHEDQAIIDNIPLQNTIALRESEKSFHIEEEQLPSSKSVLSFRRYHPPTVSACEEDDSIIRIQADDIESRPENHARTTISDDEATYDPVMVQPELGSPFQNHFPDTSLKLDAKQHGCRNSHPYTDTTDSGAHATTTDATTGHRKESLSVSSSSSSKPKAAFSSPVAPGLNPAMASENTCREFIMPLRSKASKFPSTDPTDKFREIFPITSLNRENPSPAKPIHTSKRPVTPVGSLHNISRSRDLGGPPKIYAPIVTDPPPTPTMERWDSSQRFGDSATDAEINAIKYQKARRWEGSEVRYPRTHHDRPDFSGYGTQYYKTQDASPTSRKESISSTRHDHAAKTPFVYKPFIGPYQQPSTPSQTQSQMQSESPGEEDHGDKAKHQEEKEFISSPVSDVTSPGISVPLPPDGDSTEDDDDDNDSEEENTRSMPFNRRREARRDYGKNWKASDFFRNRPYTPTSSLPPAPFRASSIQTNRPSSQSHYTRSSRFPSDPSISVAASATASVSAAASAAAARRASFSQAPHNLRRASTTARLFGGFPPELPPEPSQVGGGIAGVGLDGAVRSSSSRNRYEGFYRMPDIALGPTGSNMGGRGCRNLSSSMGWYDPMGLPNREMSDTPVRVPMHPPHSSQSSQGPVPLQNSQPPPPQQQLFTPAMEDPGPSSLSRPDQEDVDYESARYHQSTEHEPSYYTLQQQQQQQQQQKQQQQQQQQPHKQKRNSSINMNASQPSREQSENEAVAKEAQEKEELEAELGAQYCKHFCLRCHPPGTSFASNEPMFADEAMEDLLKENTQKESLQADDRPHTPDTVNTVTTNDIVSSLHQNTFPSAGPSASPLDAIDFTFLYPTPSKEDDNLDMDEIRKGCQAMLTDYKAKRDTWSIAYHQMYAKHLVEYISCLHLILSRISALAGRERGKTWAWGAALTSTVPFAEHLLSKTTFSIRPTSSSSSRSSGSSVNSQKGALGNVLAQSWRIAGFCTAALVVAQNECRRRIADKLADSARKLLHEYVTLVNQHQEVLWKARSDEGKRSEPSSRTSQFDHLDKGGRTSDQEATILVKLSCQCRYKVGVKPNVQAEVIETTPPGSFDYSTIDKTAEFLEDSWSWTVLSTIR